MGEYRYSGRIQALVEDLCVEEILCMRLKSRAGVYPTVTFWDVQYTQLYPRHAGLKILSVWEAPPEALSGPVLSGWLERCRRESGQTAWEGLIQTGARLYLHRMSDGKTRLVAAGGLEVRREQPREFRYWENGYTYRDAYLYYNVASVD